MELSLTDPHTVTAEFESDEKEASFTVLDVKNMTFQTGKITKSDDCSVGTVTISSVDTKNSILYRYEMDEKQAAVTLSYLSKEINNPPKTSDV